MPWRKVKPDPLEQEDKHTCSPWPQLREQDRLLHRAGVG